MNVSEFVWKRLQEWGLKRVFGYPGDGVGGLDVALQKALPDMEYVQVRHEEMAAFMASAHAKFTGGVGLCYATSGPGAIHLLNGLYDAKMDNQPVVAIVGQQARTALGARYQQEVDLVALFKDVASDYVAIGTVPSQVRHMVDRAVRIAQTKRSVTCIILPNDLQLMEYEDPPLAHGFTHTGVGFPAESKVPESQGLRDAAKVLNEGKKVAMLVGAGCLEATDEVLAVADKLGAGVAKALLGKAVLPDDLPFVTGGLGLLGTKPSWEMMKNCDTLLMVGSCFPYSEFLPEPGSARGVQIDIKGENLSLRYPMEVNLLGDSAATLRALPEVVDAVSGYAEVLLDGGVRRGQDIAKALALGAKAVLIGRPYLYGLAAAGQGGVERILDVFRVDFIRTLALLGCPRAADLGPEWVQPLREPFALAAEETVVRPGSRNAEPR